MFALTGQTGVKPNSWTVMLYMAADHPQPELAAITERAAIRDIKELEKVGSADDLNILVQIDRSWPGYPERYWINKGHSEPCEPFGALIGKKNIPRKRESPSGNSSSSSGDPNPLKEFLDWARRDYPADHAMLVLWGHAYGLGFGRDHDDPLTMPELAKALKEGDIDILGANACAMCYAEAAYELRNAAKFLVAPEITMPFAGWPYDRILGRIKTKPDIEPKEFAQQIVTDFMDSFGRRDVSLTLLDLNKADNLGKYIKALASAVEKGIAGEKTVEAIGDAFLDTAYGSVRPLIDLVDLCNRLAPIDAPIKKAADNLTTFLKPGDKEFVLKYDGDTELEGLHGLGIFAPSVTGEADLKRLQVSEEHYRALDLVKDPDNQWATLVYESLKTALDPTNEAVADFVKSTGATNVEERTGVAQLLVSVHRSFVKLDKTLMNTQDRVLTAMNGNGAAKTPKGAAKTPKAASAAKLGTTKPFGPPCLRLTSVASQSQYSPVQGVSKVRGVKQAVTAAPKNDRLLQTVAPLEELEQALADVEKTAKRVLTDRQFGLGQEDPFKAGMGQEDPFKAGMGQEDPFKAGMGQEDPFKAGMGQEDPFKAGMGQEDPFKAGMGILPWLIASSTAVGASPDPTMAVAGLYRQVAQALRLSEEAVAKVEATVQSLLADAPMPKDQAHLDRGTELVRRSFRELRDMVAHAKQTTGWVLTHPAYGLGPSAQTAQGSVPREQLAMAGGLSSRGLRLL